jgi:predicted DsbA family dithiol-disulfide isomerase
MNSGDQADKPTLSIDIFSDVVCPWCFIGKRQLEAALQVLAQEQPDTKVKVRWLPYFLNPDAPVEGDPYRPFLEKKFGGAAAVDALLARVQAAAENAGLELAMDKITLRGNTLNAHRLIHRFQQRGDADALVERLFSAHFQRGEFIGGKAVLLKIAVECGDEAEAVADYLDSSDDSIAVLEQARRAQKAGITGVPFFIFNGKQALSGAQPAQEILGVIHQSLDLV